ncbi:MAG TPA: type II toxin-antitoxin system HicB family antitoxin [Polyangiales bacterium]
MKVRKRYVVRYERDEDGWWVAAVKGSPAQTQGRTIEQAQERIREALAALLDVEPSELEITNDVRLRASERKALEAAKKAAQRAIDQSARADRATRTAARTFVTAGMSLHDAGTLLGVSKQRVHQILGADNRRKGAA